MEIKINYLEDYQIFKQKLSEQLSFIKEKHETINLFLNLIEDKELKIIYIFFSHLKSNIIFNMQGNNITERQYYDIILNSEENMIEDYKFKILYFWGHYLLVSLFNDIKKCFIEMQNFDIDNNTENINRLIYFLEQNNEIISILYKNNKINIEQVLNLLNIFTIWIGENNNGNIKDEIVFDKYYKIKNYFLIKMLFNLLKNIFQIELNNKNVDNLGKLFDYLNKFYTFINEINSNIIYVILNNESFHNFIAIILKAMDFDIYKKYKKNLVNFCKDIVKNNFSKSKITDNIINNIKNSFLNLSIIENNPKIIDNDLLNQDFFFDLLHSLYDYYFDNLGPLKYFNFNGIDSRISFKLNKGCLLNTIIIFSFCLTVENKDLNNDKNIYPLFTIYDESKNSNIIKLFIKQKFKRNKYLLYILDQNKSKPLLIEEFPPIENNKEYYIALNLEEKSTTIYSDKISKEIKNVNISKIEDYVIQIGYDRISQDYFKGFLGSFIILKNCKKSKKNNKIISKILNLKEKYPNIIYFLFNNTLYKFDYLQNFIDSHNSIKNQLDIKIGSILNDINESKIKYECLLYLSPSVIEFYSELQESCFDKYYLPLVPNICENQKYYNITQLNISIIQKDNIPINFLMNNGLHIICLQYEYIYQLSIHLFRNDKVDNNNDNIKEIINNILNYSIDILIKYIKYILNFYGLFKILFLNLFNCIKYLNKKDNKFISNTIIKNLGILTFSIIDDINDKSQNISCKNINESDIKKLIIFRDGLIDFLLTSELYDNSNIELINFILSILFKVEITNKNNIWKILSFTQLLENLFNNDEKIDKNNTNIQTIIFNLIKRYFLNIKNEDNCQSIFSDVFHYFMNNNKNKYYFMYNYLNLIHELITNEYYFGNNEIRILICYLNELIKGKEDNSNINNENINRNNIKNENNKEIKQKIISIIFTILIDLIFINIVDKETSNAFLDLINYLELNNEILKSITKEIEKVFYFLFNINNQEKNNDFKLFLYKDKGINISKIYSRLFKFLYTILNSLINPNVYNFKYKEKLMKNKLANEILSLLITISKKLNEEFNNEQKNKDMYLCLINFIKFYYKIVLNEDFFNHFSLLEINIFVINLSDLVYLCYNKYLLLSNVLIKIKTNNKILKKTIIEIILDIYINILFNDKYGNAHKIIYMSLNSIFDNSVINNKTYTIFYYIDYFINSLSKKKMNKEEKEYRDEIKNINEILLGENKEKYEMSYITFFLLKISSYYEYLVQKIIKIDNNALKNYFEKTIKKLIEEHIDLYKLNKEIFSKKSNNLYYNHLKDKIENYISSRIKSKNNEPLDVFLEFKQFFDQKLSNFDNPISEEFSSGNCNHKMAFKMPKSQLGNLENTNDKRNLSVAININKTTLNNTINESLDGSSNGNNENYKNNHSSSSLINVTLPKSNNDGKELIEDFILVYENDESVNNLKANSDKNNVHIKNIDGIDLYNKIIIKQINLNEFVNSIYYFEDIDANYITNYKKYLMNNILSLFFIDTFYKNELFIRMKSLYLNAYKTPVIETKKFLYPSKYKNYNNGLEAGMFLKMHNNFFNSIFFPISHPYFAEYIKNNNILNKSIKLHKKNLPKYFINDKPIFNIECELIKISNAHFGKIFVYNPENGEKFIIFKEEEFNSDCDIDNIFEKLNGEYKYLFSLTFFFLMERKNQEKRNVIKKKKRNDKILIILFSEIEEIVERRFLFLWQGFEIYLKNGKSYLFNMFSEEIKNNIFDFFNKDENIKNLIHSKDFLYKEKQISKEWEKFHLQTYEYLLLVNKYGSRTFNDNCQYPVFPWLLIQDYQRIEEINNINENDALIEKYYNNKFENLDKYSKELFKSLRKMKYPICIQTEEKKESVLQKYYDEEDKFRYHLGIHYSTSSYIFYYLMRQEPYSDLLIELQNYQQENPNRMFIGINESIILLSNNKDPREIIPELFTRIEYLINLNCIFFGYRVDHSIVDDNLIYDLKQKKDNNPLYKFVHFIIEHHKLLNSKIISLTINDWIDNIFGINQLPQNKKIRENSCNIFMKNSYEQEVNLAKKFDKYLIKIKNDEKNKSKILNKLSSKISSIFNFGQTPYQVFKEKHSKRHLNEIKNEIQEEKENEDDDNLMSDGFENVYNILNTQSINYEMRGNYNYLYFDINPILDIIFAVSEERNIEIVHTKLFNKKGDLQYSLSYNENIQLPYFLFNEKINIRLGSHYHIYKIKYAFSSFDDNDERINYQNINTKEIYHTYGREIIEKITSKKVKEKKVDKKNNNIYYKFITCRYIDKSFKIHIFPKNIKNRDKELYKPISFICEDFVSSCCSISFCQFLIGLKNGKLIQFYIEKHEKNDDSKSNNIEFQIKMERYIQAHNGKINIIEINKKLGIIITCGDDNYILIRKLYDFELLSPIKIKPKYIITMARVSPLNFLYIICYNKEKRESIIFGYTLTGLKFAKSDYSFYDSIDFTPNGNIVTYKNKNDLCILLGSNLKNIKMNKNDPNYDDFVKKKNKLNDSVWVRFDYFIRDLNEETNYNKIITYYKVSDKKIIATLDVTQNKYFD